MPYTRHASPVTVDDGTDSTDAGTARAAADQTCGVCGGTAIETPVLGPLARCRRCGFVFYPRSHDLARQIASLYAGDYFTGAEFGDYASQQPTFARNFRAYLGRMRRAGATRGKLIEVGCAYGFFLDEARSSFDAVGLDVNEAAVAAASSRGVHARCAEFLDFTPDSPADVVCLWDTIEHVLDPRAYLDKAHSVMAPAGLLFLTTGDIGSPMARLRGAKWRMIHPPSHLNYFSRVTMTRLLDGTGFDVLSIRSVGTWRDLANTLHLLALFSKTPLVRRVADLLDRTLGRRLPPLGFYLNLHDIMFVAARRRPSS